MARPLQRPHRISFRVSAEELAAINQRRGGVITSDYIRAAALGAPIQPASKRRQMSEFEAAKVRQLAFIGNNLNQIARRTNYLARRSPNGGAATLAEILFSLLSIERSFRAALDATEHLTETEAENAV